MFYSRIFYLIFSSIIFIGFILGEVVYSAGNASSQKIIAITQIVAHPSLDKVRQGVIDELAAEGYQEGKGIKILFENAQGNISLAVQIAHHFVDERPDVIVAIATPSAQAVVNAAKGKHIPVVFATITDPVQAKLVPDLKHPGGDVTGTRNVTPINEQLVLIKKILPYAKRLGIILNYGEENSVILLKSITEKAKQFSIDVQPVGITTTADIQTATASLVGKVDALLLLQDNSVASGLPALLSVANKNNLPVFSTYIDAVQKGALAGIASDEYEIGRQTGKIVVKILRGEKPGDIAVEDPKKTELEINLDTAKKLNIVISKALLDEANKS